MLFPGHQHSLLPSHSTGALALSAMPPPASLSAIPLTSVSSATPPVRSSLGDLALMASTSRGPPSVLHLPQLLPASATSLSGGSLPGASGGMSLSISSRPVPARIVHQIQAGQFVEMRDLLGDNVAVKQHFEELHGSVGLHILPMTSRPRVREVTSLPSWVCCFLTYLAVGTSDPAVRDKLTYAVLLVREAMRHGGQGWLEYDRLFRQQVAINPTLSWNVIHPALQATTILAQRASGMYCVTCQECDHVAAQCALSQLHPPALRGSGPTQVSARNPGQAGMSSRVSSRICNSWNDGACAYPGTCTYRHICSVCFRTSHQAKDCRLRPGIGSRSGAAVPRSSTA